MKRIAGVAAAAIILSGLGGPARAGIYADELSRCVVESATEADRENLVLWIFSAIAANPRVRPYLNITEAQSDEMSASAAKLIQRLMTEACPEQTVDAAQYEGEDGISEAFGMLGEEAMVGLLADPAVEARVAGMERHLDLSAFERLVDRAPRRMLGPRR